VRLIVTEKNIAAGKIAAILAKGKPREESFYKVPYYLFSDGAGQDTVAVGLKGHVLQVEFPPEYADWRKVEPSALIDAPLIKGEMAKAVIRAVRKLAKEADSLIIATDYDREGELIGLEALEIAGDENEKLIRSARRARFSALTPGEVKRAFAELEHLSEPLARAGEARQDIDLIWGATLTRFVSLATSRLGNQFLSVGRVQSPTLALIVEREKERRAFVPEPYWVVRADLQADGQVFAAVHKEERFSTEERARAAYERTAGPGKVTGLKSTERKVAKPAPFNTTSFMTSATSLGLSASAAMNLAETLYMGGYISYPRTDNTVYPSSLDLREVLEVVGQGDFRRETQTLLSRQSLTPSRGNKRTTDHPPIYPTGPARRGELDEREWKVYELVTRRFLATLADDAVSESTRLDLDLNGEPFFVRGSRVLVPGWLEFYPYSRQKDAELPALVEGELAELLEKYLDAKETQPPSRYSQGALIELMEKHNLGTKATRHNIIQNLYDRGYIHGNPVEPTETGVKMAEALQEYAPRIASPEMTAHLEADMDAIAEREKTKDAVVTISRDLLREAYRSLEQNKEQVAARIFEGITDDRILGECPKCRQNRLRILRSKTTRKRFVGCEGYPDCDQTYPLPQRGDIVALNETCPECGSPRIKVLGGRRPWILCLDPECPTKAEYKARRAVRALEVGTVAAGGAGEEDSGNGRRATARKSRPAGRTAGGNSKAAGEGDAGKHGAGKDGAGAAEAGAKKRPARRSAGR
jgi:DNA topoisomerase-1